jgi:hypothetical protein
MEKENSMWPMLTMGPINLWSLPATWKTDIAFQKDVKAMNEVGPLTAESEDVAKLEKFKQLMAMTKGR